jgi:hypothetical protein
VSGAQHARLSLCAAYVGLRAAGKNSPRQSSYVKQQANNMCEVNTCTSAIDVLNLDIEKSS